MLRTRLILISVSALLIWLLFLLPKAVVENEGQLSPTGPEAETGQASHKGMSPQLANAIKSLKIKYRAQTDRRNSAIFADSLAAFYFQAALYDSSAWYYEQADSFFHTKESLVKAGDSYYQAFSFALDAGKQKKMAEKVQVFYNTILETEPGNLEVKTKLALTHMVTSPPMTGVAMLREVLSENPEFEPALLNMGLLSVQSGQNDKAQEWFGRLVEINPGHVQGQLMLGVVWLNKGEKEKARQQFEKVKKMDTDPALQATVDKYLKELK